LESRKLPSWKKRIMGKKGKEWQRRSFMWSYKALILNVGEEEERENWRGQNLENQDVEFYDPHKRP